MTTQNPPMAVEKPVIQDPAICIVHTRDGQHISPELAALLDPVDPATFHEYVLPANTPVELHGHDYDEYWWFTGGTPRAVLRCRSWRRASAMPLTREPRLATAAPQVDERRLFPAH